MGYMQTLPADFSSDRPAVDLATASGTAYFSMEDDLVHLKKKAEKLTELYTALESEGVLSLNVALEADALIVDQNFVKTYFESYSEEKKYQVALEAMSAGLFAVLIAAATAFSALIVKAIFYFKDKHNNTDARRAKWTPDNYLDFDQTQAEIKSWGARYNAAGIDHELNRRLDEIMAKMNRPENMSPAEKKLDHAMGMFNGISFDIFEYGPATQSIKKYVEYNLQFDVFRAFEDFNKSVNDWYLKWIDAARKLEEGADTDSFIKEALHEFGVIQDRVWRPDAIEVANSLSAAIHLAASKNKPDRHYTPEKMLAGLKRVQDTIPIERYVQKYNGFTRERELKKLHADAKEIITQLEEEKNRSDAPSSISAAEKKILSAYHSWITNQHRSMAGVLNGIVAFNKYYQTVFGMMGPIQALTDAALDVTKEQQKTTPAQSGRTEIDMGKVEEVQKDLKAIVMH